MATVKTERDFAGEIAYLTRALKAPSLRDAADRHAERARTSPLRPVDSEVEQRNLSVYDTLLDDEGGVA